MKNRMTLKANQLILMVLFVAIGIGGIGCKKQLYDMQVRKYDKKALEAEKYSPSEHVPTMWDQASKDYSDAKKMADSGDFENAYPLIKTAVEELLTAYGRCAPEASRETFWGSND